MIYFYKGYMSQMWMNIQMKWKKKIFFLNYNFVLQYPYEIISIVTKKHKVKDMIEINVNFFL